MEITHASIAGLMTTPSPARPGGFSVERLLSRPARGSGDGRGQSATLTFLADYGDPLFVFLEALAGAEETIGGVAAKVPLRFPDTTRVNLFAARYGWRTVGGVGAAEVVDPMPDPAPAIVAPGPAGTGWDATYLFAEVDVTFEVPEFNFSDSVLTSRQNRIGARVVTVPGAPYRYAPTASASAQGKPINQDIGVIIPTQEVRFTRHWVPDVAAIEAVAHALVYHTNDAAITIGGKTWAPGCVLFGGTDSDEQRGGFGSAISSRVDYSFLCDDAGWDKVMSDITGKFEPVDPLIYPRGDLLALLSL